MQERTLFNRYEIVSSLGKGAQSVVYLVRDSENQSALKAAKVLKSEVFKQDSGKTLIQEFHLLESVDHENLVRVHECRTLSEDQNPIVITEYFENSKSLDAFLTESLSLNEKIQITYQILNALRYLHEKKIIHGDIKPSNILVARPEGAAHPLVKLIDFGVSQDLFLGKQKKKVGTPFYIAPEAVNEGIEFGSDLYSFGVVAYRLLISAELPYKNFKRAELLTAHVNGTPLFKPEDFKKCIKYPKPF